MENQQNVQASIQEQLKGIFATVIEVITNPKGFFSEMPKTGGFQQPLVFMVVLGVVSGLITSILSLCEISLKTAR